jgi:hypothetical protein
MGMAMGMPIKRVLETLVEMEIKYCQQFFTRDHMVLLHLSLLIFDCRCCSILGENTKWNAEDYKSLIIV